MNRTAADCDLWLRVRRSSSAVTLHADTQPCGKYYSDTDNSQPSRRHMVCNVWFLDQINICLGNHTYINTYKTFSTNIFFWPMFLRLFGKIWLSYTVVRYLPLKRVNSMKYKYKQPPRQIVIHSLKPLFEVIWDAFGHIFCRVNEKASRYVPDKDVIGKNIINAGIGGCFDESPTKLLCLHSGNPAFLTVLVDKVESYQLSFWCLLPKGCNCNRCLVPWGRSLTKTSMVLSEGWDKQCTLYGC